MSGEAAQALRDAADAASVDLWGHVPSDPAFVGYVRDWLNRRADRLDAAPASDLNESPDAMTTRFSTVEPETDRERELYNRAYVRGRRDYAAEVDAAPTDPGTRRLMTEPHDGHPASETCPGCPHDDPGTRRVEDERPDCTWSRCRRSPNPCFAWCKCACHQRPPDAPSGSAPPAPRRPDMPEGSSGAGAAAAGSSASRSTAATPGSRSASRAVATTRVTGAEAGSARMGPTVDGPVGRCRPMPDPETQADPVRGGKWADRDLFAADADVTVYWPNVRPCYDEERTR